jgi:DNA-directed RNA polymerase subunit K/omega
MIQPPEEFDSIFRYIVVVSQRAEQLINGAKARVESRFKKPTLQARDDVEAGEVNWRVLTQEELDAQRQALVEQFKAEVGAATEAEAQIPDVLPTTEAEIPAAEAAGDTEDRDEELERLQRLLGMARKEQGAEEAPEENDLNVGLEDAEEKPADGGEKD